MVGCRRTGGRQPCKGASNRSSGSTRQGDLRATYDVTGNLTELRVDRDGTCIPSGKCSQVFRYQWDEVGRLVTAKRWDAASLDVTSTADPVGVADVELHYGYDASDMRVSKRAVDTQGEESNTLYIFGSLELRRTIWDTPTQDYALNPETEVAYLFANGVRLARLAYEAPGDVPSMGGETLHVFFELGDHLGSTSVVLDKATGELVERSTYQAYGGSESDYRPERWKHFREDYRFTGKEEDVEVGLIYFGKRFLNPLLNRWVSADPLAVHGLGADPNLYAYVSGRVLQAVDPLGLQDSYVNPAKTFGGYLQATSPAFRQLNIDTEKIPTVGISEAKPPEPPPIIPNVIWSAGPGPLSEAADQAYTAAKISRNPVEKAVGYTLAGFSKSWSYGLEEPVRLVLNAPKAVIDSGQHAARGYEAYKLGNYELMLEEKDAARDEMGMAVTGVLILGQGLKLIRPTPSIPNGGLGKLVHVDTKDPAAVKLAKRLGGKPTVKFENLDNEFDAVSDAYVAQTKPAGFTKNKSFRKQARTTFEAAIQSDRTPYFHFEGPPDEDVLKVLERYGKEYGVQPKIDVTPLGQ